jgi:hypothetical protein
MTDWMYWFMLGMNSCCYDELQGKTQVGWEKLVWYWPENQVMPQTSYETMGSNKEFLEKA